MAKTWHDIESKTKQIISDQLGINHLYVSLESHFVDDLGADSLDQVELVVAIEREFDIEILDDEFVELANPRQYLETLTRILPSKPHSDIASMQIAFRLGEDGKIQVLIRQTDGTWMYADGTQHLPSGIFITAFSKWNGIIRELEELINWPKVEERDLQRFFEKHPDLLKGDEYDVLIPQACIINEKDSGPQNTWKADFVLHPYDESAFCKVVELKTPQLPLVRSENHGHVRFFSELNAALIQLRDYGEAFHSSETRRKFRQRYAINVFRPDLQLIAGRRWDIMHIRSMQELQRRESVAIDSWDSAIEKLRRKFA